MEKYLETSGDDNNRLQNHSLEMGNDSDSNVAKQSSANNATLNNISTLTIETTIPSITDEIFELYKSYQIAVHGDTPDEITVEGFERFLVASSLNYKLNDNISIISISSSSSSQSTSNTNHRIQNIQYGTYHQLYRLNNKLIAVGVIDILPSGLSSVYTFYDPNYRHLTLGKYTALKEIEFCHENNLEFYYMGYYIHSCIKMRYKGEYKPSELLCPTTLQWYSLEHCMPLLNIFKFTPFDPLLVEERRKINVGLITHNSFETKATLDNNTNNNNDNIVINNNNNNSNSNSSNHQDECRDMSHNEAAPDTTPITINNPMENNADNDDIDSRDSPISENKDNNDMDSVNKTSNNELDIFKPKFKNHSNKSIVNIPLDIGHDRLIYLNQLKSQGQDYLRPMLEEWSAVCDLELASKIILKLV